MKLIAIDPSITCIGFAVLEDGNLINSFSYHTKEFETKRYAEIAVIFQELLDRYKPDCIISETQYVSGMLSNSILKVVEVKGVLRGLFHIFNKNGIYLDVTPSEVRHYFNMKGKRAELKKKSVEICKQLYPRFLHRKIDDNEADAILIGLFGMKALSIRG